MRVLALALAVAFLAGEAQAQEVSPDPVITSVEWEYLPPVEVVYDQYPGLALRLSVEGDAVVTCMAETTGEITDCEITVSPQGWGFEEAALAITRLGRVRPRTVDGVPERGQFRFNVPFRIWDPGPAIYSGREPSIERLSTLRALVDEAADPGFMLGGELYGLTHQELERVMPPLLVASAIHREEWVDAFALGLGRYLPEGLEDLLSMEILLMLLPADPEHPMFPGQLSAPSDDGMVAFDEFGLVRERIWLRTRRMYCVRRDCGDSRPDIPARQNEAI